MIAFSPPNTVLNINKNNFYLWLSNSVEMTGKFRLIMNPVMRLSRDDELHLTWLTVAWEWQCYKYPRDLDMRRTSMWWDHRRWHTRAIRAIETFRQTNCTSISSLPDVYTIRCSDQHRPCPNFTSLDEHNFIKQS